MHESEITVRAFSFLFYQIMERKIRVLWKSFRL